MNPETNNPPGQGAGSMDEASGVKPRLPPHPVLSLGEFGLERSRAGCVLEAGESRLTLNARTALAHALMHADIGRGGSVLVPAYHCPAMVSPLAWLGIEPVFYPVRPDTTVDAGVLAGLVRPDTRALIAVHYFGFIQDMGHLRRFCDERGLVLIEDCAHAFFGGGGGRQLGAYGDYAIASLMKFIPVDQGGCLVSRGRSLDSVKMRSGGLFFELKSALNILEAACEYGRLPYLNQVLRIKNWLWQKLKRAQESRRPAAAGGGGSAASGADFHFDSNALGIRMSRASSAIAATVSFSRACEKRRANYQSMLAAFSGVAGARPLFDGLPDGVYPYVFPMLVDEPERVFHILKQKRVPIIRFGEYRWHGVQGSVCPVADDLSRRVLQFPCHQGLRPGELAWMVETIKNAL